MNDLEHDARCLGRVQRDKSPAPLKWRAFTDWELTVKTQPEYDHVRCARAYRFGWLEQNYRYEAGEL